MRVSSLHATVLSCALFFTLTAQGVCGLTIPRQLPAFLGPQFIAKEIEWATFVG